VKLKFPTPIGLVEFVSKPTAFTHVVAVTSKNAVYLYRPESTDAPFRTLKDLHFSNITSLKYIPSINLAISTDLSGLTEVWDSETGEFPAANLGYEFMSESGFMELPRAKTHAISLAVREEIVAMYCRDRKVRVFNVKSGKMLTVIDEGL
jgi:WD40 repeat protein